VKFSNCIAAIKFLLCEVAIDMRGDIDKFSEVEETIFNFEEGIMMWSIL